MSDRYNPYKHKADRYRDIAAQLISRANEIECGSNYNYYMHSRGMRSPRKIRMSKQNIAKFIKAANLLYDAAHDVSEIPKSKIPTYEADLALEEIYTALNTLCSVIGKIKTQRLRRWFIESLSYKGRAELEEIVKGLSALIPDPKSKREYKRRAGFEERSVAGFLHRIGLIQSDGESAIRQYRRLVKTRRISHPAESPWGFFHDVLGWAKKIGQEESVHAAIIDTWPDAEQYTR